MIISHRHKFIFIKTLKTAGTSMEIALSGICGPEDVIAPITPEDEMYRRELGFLGKQNYRYSCKQYNLRELARAVYSMKLRGFYNHIGARQIKEKIPRIVWDTYFKFCFDRNPFDKFLSFYYWHSRDSDYESFEYYLDDSRSEWISSFDLYTICNTVAVDVVYKFEELPEALDDISQRLNLHARLEMPPKKAKGYTRTDQRHYREILSEKLVDRISIFCAREMKLLGYSY